jgi:cystathionine beta-synthase
MRIARHVSELIGNTPLVQLNSVVPEGAGLVAAKIEYLNPGGSAKDRIAVKMIDAAEASGQLIPGGTIVEPTSGNTGVGLALVAQQRGYKCVFVCPDKVSEDKQNVLRAYGAEVVVCPTAVAPDHPDSYYSVSNRLVEEIDNAWKPDQYSNPNGPASHYETTGPEIWADTDGKVTHFVSAMGTTGTIMGVSRYLKEKNPNIQILGIDTYGSVFKKYKETGIFDKNEIYPYITEGIGEDFLPANVDFSIIDHFEKVTDKDAAMMTRRIPREEGIFAGNSAGSALAGILQMKDMLIFLNSI